MPELTGISLAIHEHLKAAADPAAEAAELLGAVAAQLFVRVGRPATAAVMYAIADAVVDPETGCAGR